MSAAKMMIIDKYLQEEYGEEMAKSVIQPHQRARIQLGKIATAEDWVELGKFRMESYQVRKPYMMLELDRNGRDKFDEHAAVYAAWLDNQIVASVRLCARPFESSRYIKDEELQAFLGTNYRENFLEWTRLLVAPNVKIPRLLNALIVYAGVNTLATSSYQYYFGYSTPLVKRLFANFKIESTALNFTIPHRGNHHYILFKGNFLHDFNHFVSQASLKEENV